MSRIRGIHYLLGNLYSEQRRFPAAETQFHTAATVPAIYRPNNIAGQPHQQPQQSLRAAGPSTGAVEFLDITR